MNTLLSAIKKYPREFSNSCLSRARTTPSDYNRSMHLALSTNIINEEWVEVVEILNTMRYRNALEGVVFCVELDCHMSEKLEIVKLFKLGELF
ncbi:hypothetical protein NVP1084O_212 [Vibrio phage 1.084.O._10N.261.49.F5]|nr:hypothetical protein NVP1084O_212 [Vibrio phage 1.084.O._10N.261.49.F5]